MIKIIPAPKKYEETGAVITNATCRISTEKEEWQAHLVVFSDLFERVHGVRLENGKGSGIEIYFDGSLAQNAYRIESGTALCIYASAKEGLLYALSTALQLCFFRDGVLNYPAVKIEDSPDKDYRAMMVDLGRQWHPFDKLIKYVELCFLYKVRYLNLHFADNRIYTFPSKAFPKLCIEGRHYTEEQIGELCRYASSLGVILVPEFECPGHAARLNVYYPEVFGDRSINGDGKFYNKEGRAVGNHSLLCASRESAVEGVKELIREIAELFPEAPYIHIGGDEAIIALWDQCEDCRRYMKENGIDGVYGLYSDYVARMASFVLELGKTPIVWEGFPEKGADKIPSETIVMSWENLYQSTTRLLDEGFRVINAAWKPLYIEPRIITAKAPFDWTMKDIYEWNVYNWQHWSKNSPAKENPITVEPTEQVIGAIFCTWEMSFEQEISCVMGRLAATAERVWNVGYLRNYEEFCDAFTYVHSIASRLIQDY